MGDRKSMFDGGRVLLPMLAWGTALATQAHAQEARPTGPTEADAENDAIIVTARRVDERLSDVPISISVFNQQQLDQRNVTDLAQLATYTPSLQGVSRWGSSLANFAIRGFVQESATAPSVGIYFADVVALRGGSSLVLGDGAGPGSMFDLENVQVLKGPQGTLFGRNTTGGAVLVVPKKPTDRLEGYIEGSLGNYDMQRLQAVLNLPLADTLKLRIGVDRQKRDGFLTNIGLGSRDLNDIDYTSLRASLVWEITPDLENYTIGTYVNSDTNGTTQKIIDCNDGFLSGGIPQGRLSCLQLAREGGADALYTVTNSTPQTYSRMKSFQIINTTTFHASDALTIKNIFSYGELRNAISQDAFGTGWIIPSIADQQAYAATHPGTLISNAAGVGQYIGFSVQRDVAGRDLNHQSTMSEELQFQGQIGEALQWQAGIYYELSKPESGLVGSGGPSTITCQSYEPVSGSCFAPFSAAGAGGTLTPRGRLSANLAKIRYEDIAAYAQATYKFSERLRLTAGIRYTKDKSESTAEYRQYNYNGAGVLLSTTCQASGPGAPTPPNCTSIAKKTTQAPTWVIDLDYKPVEELLLYAKYSRGYRQGLANPQALPPNDTFDAEKLDAYEIGAKAAWRGPVPGSLNVAAFYNDFKSQQLAVNYQNPVTRFTNISVNAGATSRIKGLEIDGRIGPIAGFDLSGGYALLDTELKSLPPSTPPTGFTVVPSAVVGAPLLLTPRHKGNLALGYTLPVPDTIGTIRLAATYAYTGKFYTRITDRGVIPSFGIVNLNLDWKDLGGRPLDLSLFVTNLTKKKYTLYAAEQYSSLGFISATPGEPRMWGARLRYRFGS